MKSYSIFILLIIAISQSGCAAGSATAGYALRASSSDELCPKARATIIQEAVDKSKAYADENFVKKNQ